MIIRPVEGFSGERVRWIRVFCHTEAVPTLPIHRRSNETVSLRGTAISLHTPAVTLVGGGWGVGSRPTQIPSTKICSNFHFRLGREGWDFAPKILEP